MAIAKRLIVLSLLAAFFSITEAAEIWVSPNGSNADPGTKEKPVADIGFALRKARELRRLNDPSVSNGIFIILRGGTYRLHEPVFVRPEDSGTADSPTMIQSAPGETAVISGGITVNGWSKTTGTIKGLPAIASGKIWVADAPLIDDAVLDFRQLWVNNIKTVRSKSSKALLMDRILSWHHKEESCWIPTPAMDIRNVKGLEMLIHQWWAVAVLRIKSVDVQGDSTKLFFEQPESRIQSEHPWPAPWISKNTGNSAFFLSNAIQFLDEPGEWYLDKLNRKLYYWPRGSEDLNTATVTVPYLETLVKVQGTIDDPVAYVAFKGISFQHSTWLRPSQQGHVPHQSGMYMLDAYKLKIPGTRDKGTLENQAWVGRPAAAVEVSFASNVSVGSCRFEHLASTGLDFKRGVQNCQIKGNLFKDIGGTGIHVGIYSDESHEVHVPYDPKDERDVCSNVLVENNLVTDVANEDWGAIGISAGYVRNVIIAHNDISEVSYTGISMGWGWSKTINAMRNNRISANKIQRYGKHMYDVSAIYTLSAQPASSIVENYIDSIYKAPYAHDPNHWFYLYTDEGSSYFTVKDNWTPSDKYLQNANGPGNIWDNNGPEVADAVKRSAGLEASYKYLQQERAPVASGREINHSERTKAIELIGAEGTRHSIEQVEQVLKMTGSSKNNIYQWTNHTVIYGAIENPGSVRKALLSRFTGSYVKLYNAPFYEFNRLKDCPGATAAKEWDHILLTANLVKDTTLQKEYLDYHASQFKLWPEVSQGFCNADFQQLLVFRNERQLMLVISIPKGASLDKLNPKTTENNPRVNDWNNLMKKYQEGIPGTKPGETWVFLEKQK